MTVEEVGKSAQWHEEKASWLVQFLLYQEEWTGHVCLHKGEQSPCPPYFRALCSQLLRAFGNSLSVTVSALMPCTHTSLSSKTASLVLCSYRREF